MIITELCRDIKAIKYPCMNFVILVYPKGKVYIETVSYQEKML